MRLTTWSRLRDQAEQELNGAVDAESSELGPTTG